MPSWMQIPALAAYASLVVYFLVFVSAENHRQAPNSALDEVTREYLTETGLPKFTEEPLFEISSARTSTVGFQPHDGFPVNSSDELQTSQKESQERTDSPYHEDLGEENTEFDNAIGKISATDKFTDVEEAPESLETSINETFGESALDEHQNDTFITLSRHDEKSKEPTESTAQNDTQNSGLSAGTTVDCPTEDSTTTSNRISDLINSGTLSKSQTDQIYAALTYISIPLAAVGLALTVLTVTVFLQPAMRSACSSYLVALGIAEILYLLCSFASLATAVIYGIDGTSVYAYLVIGLYVSTTFVVALRRIAFVITLIVNVERFLVVAFPLKSWRVGRHPVLISACVYGIVLSLHVINATRFEIFQRGPNTYGFKARDWWQTYEEIMVGVLMAIQILFVYLPLCGTLVLNVLTALALYLHRRKTRKLRSTRASSSSSRGDTQTTVAILGSTFVFVLLSLPSYVSSIVGNYSGDFGMMEREHYLYLVLLRAFTCLEILSNIADFIAYVALSRRFRATVVFLLCRCICRARFEGSASSTDPKDSSTQRF